MVKAFSKKIVLLSFLPIYLSSCSYIIPSQKASKEEFRTISEQVSQMPSGAYELDMGHASVHFKVNHLGLSNYTARFTDFSAILDLDPTYPEKSKLVATIKSNSVKTDFPFLEKKDFDKFLSENENWLNSKKFPEIKFESSNIVRNTAKTAIMKGSLTMLGVTKPAEFEVTFNGLYKNKPHSGIPALGFSATAKIKRSEWGFVAFVPAIGDEVTIIIETEFHKKD